MQHPGPPQFMAVGESVQLAPRDPDPDADYSWRVRSAPVASSLELDEDTAVVQFTPDAAGRYVVELDAPDVTYTLTVRVFPGSYLPAGSVRSGASGMSGMSGYSGQSGSARPTGSSGGASGSGSGAGDAQRGRGGRPRIRLDATVEDGVVVVRADPHPNPDSDTDRDDLVVEFVVDDRDEVDDAAVETDGWELRVPLSAIGDRLRVHAVALDETYSVPDTVTVEREAIADGGVAEAETEAVRADVTGHTDGSGAQEASVSVSRPNDPPQWAQEVTLYEIYVRGYASDVEDADNTFEALETRLDYLESLGVDCLWLTPVLENDHAPHGYNIVDFYDVAEDLGTREDYERFVEAAHDRGMKVLFDLVLNHSARAHPFFEDAYKNPDSEYYDWYEWQENGEPGTYFDWEYIANFDHRNLEVRRYLLDAVDMWAEVVDGFRCDMAWAVPDTFWQEIRDRVKAKDPEFLLLDETIPYIADFHEGMFDMHFDTTLYFTLRQVGRGDEPAERVLDAIEQRTQVGFPDHASFMLYLENHDETRYIVECGEDEALAAAGALFTLPGVPMVYGGQEIGQRGRRDALAWDHARDDVREHYERLIEVRDETPALRHDGTFRRIDYEADSDRAVAFVRDHDDGSYLCALNFAPGATTVDVGDLDVDATDVVSGDSVAAEGGVRVDDVVVCPLA
ncbi:MULTISPECIES: alpha-amylase MalA [Haloferax]|uniref:Alpha-amylase 2 n=3 Tax=Haloferax TaxID=2251 RepID=A0A0D6JPH7_9EURY|nr:MULTISPECIES: alpha-amylase MalA [Haloferax]CQR49774.1 Alpha-amylase 2 [Haloferax massiliensis]